MSLKTVCVVTYHIPIYIHVPFIPSTKKNPTILNSASHLTRQGYTVGVHVVKLRPHFASTNILNTLLMWRVRTSHTTHSVYNCIRKSDNKPLGF